jgi:hypothetical protein
MTRLQPAFPSRGPQIRDRSLAPPLWQPYHGHMTLRHCK